MVAPYQRANRDIYKGVCKGRQLGTERHMQNLSCEAVKRLVERKKGFCGVAIIKTITTYMLVLVR